MNRLSRLLAFCLFGAVAYVGADVTYRDSFNPSTGNNEPLKSTVVSGVHTPHVTVTSRAVAAADVHAPAANTAAVVTYAAGGAGVSHVVSGVAWSYTADPTGGNLKIEDGAGTTVFSVDITSKGTGFISFPFPKKGSANAALIVTLAAGGSGISGKVSVLNHWTE